MSSSVEQLLARVERHVEAGNLWRAKELLRGAIGSGHTDVQILERYGQVLDGVGDRIEAGKYLFLSGIRRPEYAGSIQLFLTRHSRGGPKNFVAQLPASIRCRPLNELPVNVIAELKDHGVTAALFVRIGARRVSKPGPWQRRAIGAVALGVFVAFVAAAIVGVFVIVAWLRGIIG